MLGRLERGTYYYSGLTVETRPQRSEYLAAPFLSGIAVWQKLKAHPWFRALLAERREFRLILFLSLFQVAKRNTS